MAGEDLPAPQFQETKSTFGVTLHGHGRYLHTVRAPHHVAATATDGALTARRTQEERQAWALEQMRTVGPLMPRDDATVLGG